MSRIARTVVLALLPLALTAGSSHPAGGAPPADPAGMSPVQIEAKGWHVSHVILTPDSKTMVSVEQKLIEGGKYRASLVYRALPSGEELRRLHLPDDCPSNLFFHPDGHTIVLGHSSGGVDLLDAAGRRREAIRGTKEGILPLALSPNGKTLVGMTCYYPRKVFVWDMTTGRQLHAFPPAPPPDPRFQHPPQALPPRPGSSPGVVSTFSEDGDTVISEGRLVELWDVASWKLLGPVGDYGVATGECGDRLAGDYRGPETAYRPSGYTPCLPFGTANADWRVRTVPGGRRLLLPCYQQPPVQVVPHMLGRHNVGGMKLEDRQTHAELYRFKEFRDGRWRIKVLLTPDARTMIAWAEMANADDTSRILIWDISHLLPADPAKTKLSPVELAKLWTAMGDIFLHACPAMRTLAANPEQAVTLLRAQLKPADLSRAAKLVRGLDSDDFGTRQRAEGELERLGVPVLPALRKALRNPASAEAARRLRGLIQHLEKTAEAEEARVYRSIDLLEHIASPAARQFLTQLADGAQGGDAAASAKAAIARLEKPTSPR